jgi:MFS family permease
MTFLMPGAFRIGGAEAGPARSPGARPETAASANVDADADRALRRAASGTAETSPEGPAISPAWRGWLASYRLPPEMRAPVAAAIALAVSQIALSSFAYFYLLEVTRVTPVQAGAYLSNTLIASVVGRLVVGWLADRIGSAMRALTLIQVISALACLALPAIAGGAPGWALLLLAIASGVSTGSWSPIFMTAISNLAPAGRMADFNGRAFSYAALGWCLAAPLIWSGIELGGGYQPVWYALGGLNLWLAWRGFARRPQRA